MTETPTAVALDYPSRPINWAHTTWARDRIIETALETHPKWLARIQAKGAPTESGCIEWTGWVIVSRKTKYGASIIPSHGGTVRIHRVTWLAEKGPLALGWVPDHLCKNTICFNIEHLEAVPVKVNNMRGDSPHAKHARATHCPAGHEFTERKGVNGQRSCLICTAALTHVRDVLGSEAARLSAKRGRSMDALIDALGGEPVAIATLRSHAQEDALRLTACGKGRWANLARKALGVTA